MKRCTISYSNSVVILSSFKEMIKKMNSAFVTLVKEKASIGYGVSLNQNSLFLTAVKSQISLIFNLLFK